MVMRQWRTRMSTEGEEQSNRTQPDPPSDPPEFRQFLFANRLYVANRIRELMQEGRADRNKLACAIYTDVVFMREALGTDPFAPRFPGDEGTQADRLAVANMA